jgi:CubicO group peptidase (beta-lactamase class C family)
VGTRLPDRRRGRPGLRSIGSLSWGGINNTWFWIDPAREIAGVILMQFLPFADPKALSQTRSFPPTPRRSSFRARDKNECRRRAESTLVSIFRLDLVARNAGDAASGHSCRSRMKRIQECRFVESACRR